LCGIVPQAPAATGVDDAGDDVLVELGLDAADALVALLLLDELPHAAKSTPTATNATNPPIVRFNPDILPLLSQRPEYPTGVRTSSKPRCS
jgi:hypothetical protein